MLTTTTFDLAGYKVTEQKGMVRGIAVRSPTIKQGIRGGLKGVVGGNIKQFNDMCEQTRGDAYEKMLGHARELGANAVLGVRYDASEVVDRATEVLCYGTAVVVIEEI